MNKDVKTELKKEMGRIRDLWDHYFIEHKSLNSKTWSPKNTDFKYVGTILGNFIDTFDVIYDYNHSQDERYSYSSNMSLMQAIYIQQDIMEDLLLIFRCSINKEHLKQDDDYSINRNIRNELMGHPIRRTGAELTSTTLIAYNGKKGCINYMRHHKDTGFQFELISHKVTDILTRHTSFIKTYFGKIIQQIKKLMKNFIKQLKQIQNVIDSIEFPQLLNFTDTNFESIYRQDFGYDNLREIYEKRVEHPRYQHFIDYFKEELKSNISGHLENIEEKFNPPEEVEQEFQSLQPIFEIDDDGNIQINIDNDSDENVTVNFEERNTYSYEIGKLATNRDLFQMCYNIIKEGCADNKIIVEELEHMKNNLFNNLEYYCALRMIRTELKFDEY